MSYRDDSSDLKALAPVTAHTVPSDVLMGGLVTDTVWSGSPPTLSYAFATTNAHHTYQQNNFNSSITGTFDPLVTTDAETAALREDLHTSFERISAVTNLNFSYESDASQFASVDFKLYGYDDLRTGSGLGLNGRSTFPGDDPNDGTSASDDFESHNFFETVRSNMTTDGERGATAHRLHVTIHELGHGLGLSHPHSTHDGASAWASSSSGSGDNELDNDRYTIMSYERGGLNVNSQGLDHGYAATPMALDIAALHNMYGSTANHTSNTTYTLTDPRSADVDLDGSNGSVTIGRAFYSIWDTGGTDQITYSGANHALLNLNEATLDQSSDPAHIQRMTGTLQNAGLFGDLLPSATAGELRDDLLDPNFHAGGFFSRVFDDSGLPDLGGYSIANGANASAAHQSGTGIENAVGSAQSDILIGNEGDNALFGNAGDDLILGSAGDDTVRGAAGEDELFGNRGDDTINGADDSDKMDGGDGSDTLNGGAGDDNLRGGGGDDLLRGGSGDRDTAVFSGLRRDYEINQISDTEFEIVDTRGDDGTDTLQAVEFAKFNDSLVELGETAPIDFTFLQDLSGSFIGDLPNVQAAARSIVDAVRGVNPDSQFAVGSFFGDNYSTSEQVHDYKVHLPMTDSSSNLVNAIDALEARNLGIDESQLKALHEAAKGTDLSYRADTQRFVLLSTDEGYTSDSDRPAISTVKSALEANNVTPIFAVTSGVTSTYEGLVGQLGRGSVVNLSSNSDNLADSVRAALGDLSGAGTTGTSSGDTMTGHKTLLDSLFGLGGGDTLNGRGGDDLLDGGSGYDDLYGGTGEDTLRGGSGNDTLNGDAGNDYLDGGAGGDDIYGGSGEDRLSYAGSPSGVEIDLTGSYGSGGHADGDWVIGVEHVTGSDLGDTLKGTDGVNRIVGGDGNDVIQGRDGQDILNGGAGNDAISYADAGAAVQIDLRDLSVTGGGNATGDTLSSFESAIGSDYADELLGTSGDNVLEGSGGADFLRAGAGEDTLSYAGAPGGVDVLMSSGYAGRGDAAGDVFYGFEHLRGSAYADVLGGDSQDNVIAGGDGGDVLIGGGGQDAVSYAASDYRVTVSLATGYTSGGHAYGDRLLDIDDLIGSRYNDSLAGDDTDNVLRGGVGDDTLNGNGGTDIASYATAATAIEARLWRGSGDTGESAGDSYTSIEGLAGSRFDDYLVGDSGDNVLQGNGGQDDLVGSAGSDTASYADAEGAVSVRLWRDGGQRGEAAGDTFTGIENLRGSDHDDYLVGDSGANILEGDGGADELVGAAGEDTASYANSNTRVAVRLWKNEGQVGEASGDTYSGIEHLTGSDFDDYLVGDSGDNVLQGLGGADTLVGSAGYDIASYADADERVVADIASGDAQRGDAVGDTYSGIEALAGSAHNDRLLGDGRDDDLRGGRGRDELVGNGGDDLLQGQVGADTLMGGQGDDILMGGRQADTLVGGQGSDTAAYTDAGGAVSARLWQNAGQAGDADGDTYTSIENLTGTAFNDLLVGDSGDNVLNGGVGADDLVGSAGTDTASYADADGAVSARLWRGTGQSGEAGGDTYNGIENLTGSDFDDTLVGDSGNNVLQGNAGQDELVGSSGFDYASYADADSGVGARIWQGGGQAGEAEGDTFNSIEGLIGSRFDDVLIGDNGFNVLSGGAGNDLLGGAGSSDRFVFDAGFDQDRIGNWQDGEDKLDLTGFGFSGFGDIYHAATDTSDGLRMDFGGGDRITLTGFSKADLDSSDVLI